MNYHSPFVFIPASDIFVLQAFIGSEYIGLLLKNSPRQRNKTLCRPNYMFLSGSLKSHFSAPEIP